MKAISQWSGREISCRTLRVLFPGAHECDIMEINVPGKAHREGEAPHELFTQLRKGRDKSE